MFSSKYISRLEQSCPNNLTIVSSIIVSSLVLLIFILPSLVSAQTSCGNFIYEELGEEFIDPIVDCDNPFGLIPAVGEVEIGFDLGEVSSIEPGGTYEVSNLPVDLIWRTDLLPEDRGLVFSRLYKHEGGDYRILRESSATVDSIVATGTYTIVTNVDVPRLVVVAGNYAQKFVSKYLSWLIPTANASIFEYPFDSVQTAFTFTVELAPPPTGASNILFIPGIQASRLYKDGVFGTEDQIWEPNINQDVSQLAMTEAGQSINDIYTKDVIDEVFGVSNIYKSILDQFEYMKDEEIIADYLPFAYDWRYNVQDIAYGGTKYENDFVILVDELESLAASSYSGKVTIVAHSNGGLLAKALVTELVGRGLDNLVDKVIFIATPHLGTPKAIATILHGYDQQRLGGAIIDDKTVRSVVKNMPGVYSLLPSAKYLEIFGSPLITFGEGEVTELYREEYGDSIDTLAEYVDFLNGIEGRVAESDNISEPTTANSSLFDWALSGHENKLDNWSAPEGIEVHNIVGVGIKTVKSLEYRELQEYVTCSSNIFGQINCDEPVNFIRPYAHFTVYGDETVTSLSAESIIGQTYYFDFASRDENTITAVDREHGDITEVDEIRFLIGNIINSTTTPVDYVKSELPEYNREYRVVSVDSPVRIVVEDDDGNKTGVIVKSDDTKEVLKEISGSEYLEFAGTKYLIVPKDIDTVTTLYGEAYGGFTLTRATLGIDDVQVVDTVMINATTTPNMIARFSNRNEENGVLEVDIDGDGAVDYQTDLLGNTITDEAEDITFDSLREQIKALDLKRKREKLLITILDVAERAYERADRHRVYIRIADRSLVSIIQLVERYERLNWLAEEEGSALQESITKLRANIKQS